MFYYLLTFCRDGLEQLKEFVHRSLKEVTLKVQFSLGLFVFLGVLLQYNFPKFFKFRESI